MPTDTATPQQLQAISALEAGLTFQLGATAASAIKVAHTQAYLAWKNGGQVGLLHDWTLRALDSLADAHTIVFCSSCSEFPAANKHGYCEPCTDALEASTFATASAV